MEKIPTARTFLQNLIEENNHDSNVDLEDALIEFAKLHVEQALKKASEKGDITYEIDEIGYNVFSVDKDSILNSYSLDNIK